MNYVGISLSGPRFLIHMYDLNGVARAGGITGADIFYTAIMA